MTGRMSRRTVLRAAGALLRYVQDTQLEFLPHVKALQTPDATAVPAAPRGTAAVA